MTEFPINNWTPWSERLGIPGIEHPGVYLMANFEAGPPSKVDPTSDAIVYIGETCRSLRDRWRSFQRAIAEGKPGHSGGLSYHTAFCQECPGSFEGRLFVAAIPITLSEPHASAYVRLLERSLIWNVVKKHGRYPISNSK